MKQILLSLIFISSLFAQVDSMRVTWTEATDADLYGTIIYGDTIALPTTVIDTVLAGTEELEWLPTYGGLWRIRAKSLDDSSNTSTYSSVDTVTIWRDSIPSQFTFLDSTGAAVSSQVISRTPVVLAGFDSAAGTVTGGDYKIGVLGSLTRASAYFSVGDSVWLADTSSASNSTATNVILTIAGIKDTFTVRTESGAATYTTDSLKLYWDDDDLTNGAIADNEWVDQIRSTGFLTYGTAPTMTDSGVVFSGSGVLYVSTPFTVDTSMGLTLETVIKIVDTTNAQLFTVVLGTYGISSSMVNSRFAVRVATALNKGSQVYSTPTYNNLIHIVITYDNADGIKIYFNGTLQTEVNTTIGYTADGDYTRMGGVDYYPANGTIIRLMRFYTKDLSSTEVTTNYNSASVQD